MKFLRTPFSQNTSGRLLVAPLRSSYCRDFLVLHNYFEQLYELGRIFGIKKVSIKDVSQELLCNFSKLLSHPSENVSILFSASFVRPFKRRRILKNFCSETLQGINKNTPMTKTFCSKKIRHWCLKFGEMFRNYCLEQLRTDCFRFSQKVS